MKTRECSLQISSLWIILLTITIELLYIFMMAYSVFGASNDLTNQFDSCQCTNFAYENAPETIKRLIKWTQGTKFDGYPNPPSWVSWNAGQWVSNITAYGPQLDTNLDWEGAIKSNPEVGSVVVYDPNSTTTWTKDNGTKGSWTFSSYGHVAVVTQINSDSTIDTQDKNWVECGPVNRENINVTTAMHFISTPARLSQGTPSKDAEKRINNTSFTAKWPVRNIWVKTSSKFELRINGSLIMAQDRPDARTTYAKERVTVIPFKANNLEIVWWQQNSEAEPEFIQTWWPNKITSAAEPDPDGLAVVYSYVIHPDPIVVGEQASITVGASNNLGMNIQSIDIFLGEKQIGEIQGSLETMALPTEDLVVGENKIRLHANIQNWSGEVNEKVFSIIVQGSSGQSGTTENIIPPILNSPENGSGLDQNSKVKLSWNNASDASEYKVEVWGGPYDRMTPCDWQAGTSCKIGQMWSGTMSWHVKARSTSGQESEWSDTWSFTVEEETESEATPTSPTPTVSAQSSVEKPILSKPANSSSWSKSTEIKLTWEAVSGADEYKVELWGGPYDTMTPCDWQSRKSCYIGIMWPGTMSWHVKARSSSGQESEWSDTWSFTVEEETESESTPTSSTPTSTAQSSINAPNLSNPENSSSWARSTEIKLSWQSVSGANEYKVELWGGPYDTMTPCDWQSSKSCFIGTMWPGTMSWHVKVRSASGQESEWSETRSFTIQEISPTATTKSEPGFVELVDNLSLRADPSGSWPPIAGDKLIAHIKIKNGGDTSIHILHIGVRGRRNGSESWDIGFWGIDVNGHQEWSLDPNNERPLQPGSYSFKISYSIDGSSWVEIGNEINFTVN